MAMATLLCSSQDRVKSRAVPDLCANSSSRAVVLSCDQRHSLQLAASAVQVQTFHHKFNVKAQALQAGQALVLAVSESSARRDQCLWQQCVPFCAIDCREGESVFLCQLTNLFPPLLSSNTTWRRLGSKPRVLAASPRELAKEPGLGAPPRLPLPHLVCLSLPLSRPSISVSGSQVST